VNLIDVLTHTHTHTHVVIFHSLLNNNAND